MAADDDENLGTRNVEKNALEVVPRE